LQIRTHSYKGGNTNFFNPQTGQVVDYQEKLPCENLCKIVEAKKNFLANFKLEARFSNKLSDKTFRAVTLGPVHVLSLLSWKIFHWLNQATNNFPNNEKLIIDNNIEDMYWQRFEKSVALLKQVSLAQNIKIGVLLVSYPDWFSEYEYRHKYNRQEQKYQELFDKYGIAFEYSIEEMSDKSRQTGRGVFWRDKHPNTEGSKAVAESLEKLLTRMIR
jgi:adenylate kinase family enzyme